MDTSVNNKNLSFLDLGAESPVSGGMKLALKLDGEKIIDVNIHNGYWHQGIEKTLEQKSFNQISAFLSRMDQTAPFSGEYPFILALENLTEIIVPERAKFIRAIYAELARIISHVMNIGTMANSVGMEAPFKQALAQRKSILDLYCDEFGTRQHFVHICYGGVLCDFSDDFVAKLEKWLDFELSGFLKCIEKSLLKNQGFILRTDGIGVIDSDDALEWGTSGVNLRASGVALDFRKVNCYDAYSLFDFDIPCGKNGDCLTRFIVRFEEIIQSVKIIRQAINLMPKGEINLDDDTDKNNSFALNKKNKVPFIPSGEIYASTESPQGENGVFIVSDGSEKPYRCALKRAGFSHAQALEWLLKGQSLEDIFLIVSSFDVSALNFEK